ncbi:MAG: ATP-binding cassette domain-containing protein, partial [Chloroflexi bacterium]|nr:ATP-binding cassette domain-containing protein [Chloroflexota bacterium]
GASLSDLSDNALTELRRRKIGFVFQFYNLISVLNAVENAALPLTLDGTSAADAKSKAVEWLEKVGLGNRLNSRPDQLSGGQQQRVAVARALVAEPALALADEPTGNLDSRASHEIAELLRRIAGEWGRAVVMVTHDSQIATYAGRIIFLKDGKIVDETRVERYTGIRVNAQVPRLLVS